MKGRRATAIIHQLRPRRWFSYVGVVMALSLLTWMFFFFEEVPLTPGSTLIVVLFHAGAVGLLLAIARRMLGKRGIVALVLSAAVLFGSAFLLLFVSCVQREREDTEWRQIPIEPRPRLEGLTRSFRVVETGRAALFPHQHEEPGYALYSYLFFRGAPTAQNRDRYLAALTAFGEEIPQVVDLRRGAAANELNIAYLVLSTPWDPETRIEDLPMLWLHTYDFARARLLLRIVPDTVRDGPYIISYDQPLGSIKHGVGREDLLFQDLSWVPPALVRAWVKQFLLQASRPAAFAREDPWRQFVLRLRTGIEVAAQGLPEVEQAWADAKDKWEAAVKPVKVRPSAR